VLGKRLGEGILGIRSLCEVELRQTLILRMLSPEGFTVCKAQLLSILNLKSSSSQQQRNFGGSKVAL
jgi:hypothetical protein